MPTPGSAPWRRARIDLLAAAITGDIALFNDDFPFLGKYADF